MTDFHEPERRLHLGDGSDPRLRSTVVTVILLDKSPDWDVVGNASRWCRATCQCSARSWSSRRLPTPPRWEFAPISTLTSTSAGCRHRAGQPRGVLEMARVAAMADFDRARPLWTATLIEGGSRTAEPLCCASSITG